MKDVILWSAIGSIFAAIVGTILVEAILTALKSARNSASSSVRLLGSFFRL